MYVVRGDTTLQRWVRFELIKSRQLSPFLLISLLFTFLYFYRYYVVGRQTWPVASLSIWNRYTSIIGYPIRSYNVNSSTCQVPMKRKLLWVGLYRDHWNRQFFYGICIVIVYKWLLCDASGEPSEVTSILCSILMDAICEHQAFLEPLVIVVYTYATNLNLWTYFNCIASNASWLRAVTLWITSARWLVEAYIKQFEASSTEAGLLNETPCYSFYHFAIRYINNSDNSFFLVWRCLLVSPQYYLNL